MHVTFFLPIKRKLEAISLAKKRFVEYQ